MNAKRPIGIAVAGLGSAARMMLPSLQDHPRWKLSAITDIDRDTLASVADMTGARASVDLDAMLAAPDVDVVYIATPTLLHATHVRAAAAAGKHVIVEKPRAETASAALAMIEAAERAGIFLIVGHSRSFDIAIRRMREIIAAGTLGRPRMIQSTVYTDWIYRPRRPDELDPDQGGGVIFRQGAHQFDVIRLLGGGMLKNVRASLFDMDASRAAVGAHSVFLSFEDGAAATAVYNGYGCFMTSELCFGVGERGFEDPVEGLGAARRAYLARSGGSEDGLKRVRAAGQARGIPPHHPFFGLTLVSCEAGDLRQAPDGLFLYTARGREHIPFPPERNVYDAVLAEMAQAIDSDTRPLHDGRWGLANLEVCEASLRSARSGTEQALVRQVPVR